MFKVYDEEQNKLGTIIKQGLEGQIVLFGFPHDTGAEREGVQKGQDNGPGIKTYLNQMLMYFFQDCLRRFLPKLGSLYNPEYNIDISDLQISDYGNIYIDKKQPHEYEDLLLKLSQRIAYVYKKKNIPILIGGTKDCSTSCIQPLIELYDNPQVISLIPSYDIQQNQQKNDKLSINNGIFKILNSKHDLIKQKNFTIKYFGINSYLINEQDQKYVNQNQNIIQTITIDEIRQTKTSINQDFETPITQAGTMFKQILQMNKNSNSHLSISLESINSAWFPGVSRPQTIDGFSSEEIIEILFQAGLDKQIISLDFTDYNPSKEDYRSGLLLGNMIYYFMLGFQKRKKENQ